MTSSSSQIIDVRLRNMHVRASWGLNTMSEKGNICIADENLYYMIIGKRVVETKSNLTAGGKYMFPHLDHVQAILSLSLSEDRSALGASVREYGSEGAGVVVYATDHSSGIHKRPKYLKFQQNSRRGFRYALGMSFSHDASMVACYTSLPEDGVFLYDWMLEQLVQQVPISIPINHVSFNPRDSSRVCVTGTDELFEFWHYNKKTSHVAPIRNLPNLDEAGYTVHVWLESDVVLAGTDDGRAVLVQGVEVKLVIPVFGPLPGENGLGGNDATEIPVVSILHRKTSNTIVVFGEDARMSIFELGAMAGPKKGLGLTLLSRYHILPTQVQAGTRRLSDTNWAQRSPNSMLMTLCFHGSVELFEPQRVDYVGDPQVSAILQPQKIVCEGHTAAVEAAAMPVLTTNFVTVSSTDDTVRVWNMSRENGAVPVQEVYYERKNELPSCLDMHPSGRMVAFGLDETVNEYAILNSQLVLMQRIGIRNALRSKSSDSIVNIFPASLVKYSHGGHLLAVAAGKYVQVFARGAIDYSRVRAGEVKRVMDLTDHVQNVSCVEFSHDDAHLYTAGIDGSVFKWEFKWNGGSGGRMCGSYQKGAVVNMSISPMTSTIGVLCDVSADGTMTASARKFSSRRGSVLTPKDNNSEGGDGASKGGRKLSRGSSGVMRVASKSFGQQNSFSSAMGSPMGRMTPSHVDPTNAQGLDKEPGLRQFISLWTDGTISDFPQIVEVTTDSQVVCMTFAASQGSDDLKKSEFCFMGLKDGSVLVSILPLPLRHVSVNTGIPDLVLPEMVGERTAAATGPGESETGDSVDTSKDLLLDLDQLRCMPLHAAAVSGLVQSHSGLWVATYGADGVMFLLSTTKTNNTVDMPESLSPECGIVMTDYHVLAGQLDRIEQLEGKLTDSKHSNEREMAATMDKCDKRIAELESVLAREVKRRDDIIIKERENSIQRQRELADEVESARRKGQEDVSQTEVLYERKLAQEGSFLARMRQAYDEFVVHARFDLEDAASEAQGLARAAETKHMQELADAERQKRILLSYVDYVNTRYGELMDSAEGRHEEERENLRNAAIEAKQGVEKAAEAGRRDLAFLQQELKKTQIMLDEREDQLLRSRANTFEANARVEQLENALADATEEIGKCRDSAQRWELRAGESQQGMTELEKVREVLTSQLHQLRKELAPKEWELSSTKAKLKEVGSEYGSTMTSAAEKDRELQTQAAKNHLLQKQVRQLRSISSRRNQTLKRACKVLGEYQSALQDAIFNRTKCSIVTTYVPQIGLTPKEAAAQQQAESEALAAAAESEWEAERKRAEDEAALVAAGIDTDGTGAAAAVGAVATSAGSGSPNPAGALLLPPRPATFAPRPVGLPTALHAINQKKLELATARVGVTHPTSSTDLVEVLARSPAMESALSTLAHLLSPFASEKIEQEAEFDKVEEEEANEAFMETARQLEQMRRTVMAATGDAENTRRAASAHTKLQVADNRHLIAQLNAQREELVRTRRERDRLGARCDTLERLRRQSAGGGTGMGTGGRTPARMPGGDPGAEGDNDGQASVMSDMSAGGGAREHPESYYAVRRDADPLDPPMDDKIDFAAVPRIATGPGGEGEGGESMAAANALMNSIMAENREQIERERAGLTTPDALAAQYQDIISDSVIERGAKDSVASSKGSDALHGGPSHASKATSSKNGGRGGGRGGATSELEKIERIVRAVNRNPGGFVKGEMSEAQMRENTQKARAARDRKQQIKKTLMSRNSSAPQLQRSGGSGAKSGSGGGGTITLSQTVQLTPQIGLPPLDKRKLR